MLGKGKSIHRRLSTAIRSITVTGAVMNLCPRYLYRRNLSGHIKAPETISTSPIMIGDMLYIGSMDNYIYAINRKSGILDWKFQGRLDQLQTPAHVEHRQPLRAPATMHTFILLTFRPARPFGVFKNRFGRSASFCTALPGLSLLFFL